MRLQIGHGVSNTVLSTHGKQLHGLLTLEAL